MVVINNICYAIEPFDSEISKIMQEIDPDHIDLWGIECIYESGRDPQFIQFSIGLDQATNDGEYIAQWVCPD